MSVKLEGFELRRVAMPLVSPFRTSFGTQTARDILLCAPSPPDARGLGRVRRDVATRCTRSEYVDGAGDVMRRFFLPRWRRRPRSCLRHGAHAVNAVLHKFKGHRMAKARARDGRARRRAAHRGAVLRARARRGPRHACPPACRSASWTASRSCSTRSAATSTRATSGSSSRSSPGWDVEPVRAVRERFGDDVLLQVDANTAYTLRDARHLAKLDDFDLLLIEQPLEEEDVLGHAELAQLVRTPICLDESIVSAQTAAAAIRLGACSHHQHQAGPRRRLPRGRAHPRPRRRPRAGRVVRRHARDRARPRGQRRARGAARLHPARRHLGLGPLLPDRHHRAVRPFRDGHLDVPTGPGLGVTPIPEVLDAVTTSTEWIAL